MDEQPNNPLHGVTLKALLEELVERHGFEELGRRVRIRCFNQDPSIRSSLKFLRKTPWARAEVEQLWLADQQVVQRNRRRNQRRAAMRAHRREVEAAGGIVGPLSARGEDPSEGEQESAEGNHDPAEGKPDRDEGKPDLDEGKPRQKKAKPALKPGEKGDLPTW